MKDILVHTNDRRVASRAIEAGVAALLLDRPMPEVGRVDALRLEGDAIHRNGTQVGELVRLRGREDELRVRRLKGKRELVVVDTGDWKVIPLENLIAALGGKTRLYAVARSPAEAQLFLTTLEHGVDGIMVEPKNGAELDGFLQVLRRDERPALKLETAIVRRIEAAGLGERVCIDTTNLFRPGEGVLVGSTSRGFFLVAAECYESEYVAARPFRVNAGAVHSYLLNGDGTKYLSELRTGLRIEAVAHNGARRDVVVGRAKIETRPMLLVEATIGDQTVSVILQNAETIRLVTPRGRSKSVSQLRVGDKVLVRRETAARHFGMKVEETIREQ